MNNFFQKDYEIPNESNYMRLEEGDNTFRILGTFSDGSCIMGTQYWKTHQDGKRAPVRLKMGKTVSPHELGLNPQSGEPETLKHFWAMPVYNYTAKKVQILEITQKSIQFYIKKMADNPKWGDPREYDFIVTKTKENGRTSYTISTNPKEKLDPGIMKLYRDMDMHIEALFEGADPFNYTPKEERIDINEIPDDFDKA